MKGVEGIDRAEGGRGGLEAGYRGIGVWGRGYWGSRGGRGGVEGCR